jgi:hypothetical protein
MRIGVMVFILLDIQLTNRSHIDPRKSNMQSV